MTLDDCNQSFKGLCYQKVLLFGVMEQLHLMLNLPLATKCIRCHTSQSSKGNCIHLPVLSHRPISRHIKPCVMHGQCEDRPTVTFPAKKKHYTSIRQYSLPILLRPADWVGLSGWCTCAISLAAWAQCTLMTRAMWFTLSQTGNNGELNPRSCKVMLKTESSSYIMTIVLVSLLCVFSNNRPITNCLFQDASSFN